MPEDKPTILADGKTYEPNSNKYHLEQKKVTKVVEGKVIAKEKGLFGKLGEIFLSEDAGKVKNYLVTDVIIPAIKDTIVDIVKNGIDMIFYGETRASNTRKTGGQTYVSYSNYYQPTSRNRSESRSDSNRSRGSNRDFIFDSRGEAEKVLDTLTEIISEYKVASVADLCSMVGITGDWIDNKWGWYDLKDASVRRVHGGYKLDLPKTVYIE